MCDADEAKLNSLIVDCPRIRNYRNVLGANTARGIVIATPSETHYRLAKEALLAGKDVFIEKPMALSLAEGNELVEFAKEKRQILLVGHLLEYHPAVIKLKALVDGGVLGKISYISSTRLDFGSVQQGSDVLWTFAPHDIDTILLLLGRMPTSVSVHGGDYLRNGVADVAFTVLGFAGGLKALLFLSWLYPCKERKMVVIGDKGMAVYDDVGPDKLTLYPHVVEWKAGRPVTNMADGKVIEVDKTEPLRLECEDFLHCMETREQPRVSLPRALQALEILVACQESLKSGKPVAVPTLGTKNSETHYHLAYVHPTAVLDEGCQIGQGTKIWHYTHISGGAVIGENCVLGQNVYVGPNVRIGNNVHIQNNVSVYEGVTLEDNVFCGPSCVFTNDKYPKATRRGKWLETLVKRGASIGANATLICGVTIGEDAVIGAGSVVPRSVPPRSTVYGNPARLHTLNERDAVV